MFTQEVRELTITEKTGKGGREQTSKIRLPKVSK